MRSSADAKDGRAPEAAPAEAASEEARCASCGGGALEREEVSSAFWEGERLVVVEGVPALVCQICGERYFEDETAMKLDLIRGRGFRDTEAARRMEVPVFDFALAAAAGKRG